MPTESIVLVPNGGGAPVPERVQTETIQESPAANAQVAMPVVRVSDTDGKMADVSGDRIYQALLDLTAEVRRTNQYLAQLAPGFVP